MPGRLGCWHSKWRLTRSVNFYRLWHAFTSFKQICEPFFANSMMNLIDNMSDPPFIKKKSPNRRDFVVNHLKFGNWGTRVLGTQEYYLGGGYRSSDQLVHIAFEFHTFIVNLHPAVTRLSSQKISYVSPYLLFCFIWFHRYFSYQK
jgi:hypothetical protein